MCFSRLVTFRRTQQAVLSAEEVRCVVGNLPPLETFIADDLCGTQAFGSNGQLVVNYSYTPAWG